MNGFKASRQTATVTDNSRYIRKVSHLFNTLKLLQKCYLVREMKFSRDNVHMGSFSHFILPSGYRFSIKYTARCKQTKWLRLN